MSRDIGFLEDKVDPFDPALDENAFVLSLLPYEETTTYRKGAAQAPEAIVDASGHLELFDETMKFDPSPNGILTVRPDITDLSSVTQHVRDIRKKYPVGSEVTGPVTSLADFGAFVGIEEGIEGLIYNSELATERVDEASEVVKVGQEVTALVTKVDPVEQKISLSIRALTDKEQRHALKKAAAEQAASQTTTLGDLLAEKLAEKSEEGEE